jgi:hypothetical protein
MCPLFYLLSGQSLINKSLINKPLIKKLLIIHLLLTSGIVTADTAFELSAVPSLSEYCLVAQRIVTRTEQPVELIVHDNFEAFVKSKAVIEGPQIQQLDWHDDNRVVGVSCKLKSADHLNLAFGDGTAGPDGLCQDFNRAVYALLLQDIEQSAWPVVIFDENETMMNEDQPAMTGPDWLMPYTATYVDKSNNLHIRSKGFQVDFTDPRYQKAPARFRGVHYCHLVAPEYFRDLLAGDAEPGIIIGREADLTGQRPPTELDK